MNADWLTDIEPDWDVVRCIVGAEQAEQQRQDWQARPRLQTLESAIERIEAERDGARLSAKDPALTTFQQDLAAMRGWSFSHALEILRDIGTPRDSSESLGGPTP